MYKIGELIEGFYEKDKTIYFDPKQNSKTNFIDTTLGVSSGTKKFNARVKRLTIPISNSSPKTVTIYSTYKKYSDSDDHPNILKTMKGLTDYKMDEGGFDKFISRTGIFYANFILQNHIPIDIIMTVDSSHDIAIKLKNDILKRLSDKNILNLDNAMVKDVSKLELDKTFVANMTNSQLKKSLPYQKLIQFKTGKYPFKLKTIPPNIRKFFTNWMVLKPEFDKIVQNKNIVIVDDYMTTGSTMYVACKTLFESHNVKSISVLTITKPA